MAHRSPVFSSFGGFCPVREEIEHANDQRARLDGSCNSCNILELLRIFAYLARNIFQSTRCCIPWRKPSMNKLYRLPLRTRTKNLVERCSTAPEFVEDFSDWSSSLSVRLQRWWRLDLPLFHFQAHDSEAKGGCRCEPCCHALSATPALTPKDILLPLADPNKALPQELLRLLRRIQRLVRSRLALCLDFDRRSHACAICCSHEQKTDSQAEGDGKASDEGCAEKS